LSLRTSIVAPIPNNAIFASYVALGNSITALPVRWYQRLTQRQSYALLLAKQMNTRYAFRRWRRRLPAAVANC